MARGETFLEPLFRKARLRSQGDVSAARGRLLMYSQRTPAVQLELTRKAIGQAQFTAGAHAAVIPAETDRSNRNSRYQRSWHTRRGTTAHPATAA